MSKKEIKKVENQEVAEIKKPNRGLEEGVEKSELILPRAKLMQALSPEVKEKLFDQGEIINNLTLEKLPESFVPIFKFTNFIKFNARKSTDPNFDEKYAPSAMMWNITDPHDPRVKETEFGEDGSKPTALRSMNFMALFEGHDTPTIISFNKTSYKAGKKLLSLLSLTRGDIFAKKFKLIAKEIKGEDNYLVYDIAPNGKATEEEFAVAEYLYEEFGSKKEEISQTVVDDMHSEEAKPEETAVDVVEGEAGNDVNWSK